MLDLHWVEWSCYVSREKYICAMGFKGLLTKRGDSYEDTNCAALIADLFLYCYEMDFMSNLQKSKMFHLIHKFNDTSQCDERITIRRWIE